MSETQFVTDKYRIAFPNLFEAKAPKSGGRETYSLTILLAPGDSLRPFEKAILRAAKEKFGEVKRAKNGKLRVKVGKVWKDLKTPIRDAGEKAETYKGYEEDGHYINVSSGTKVARPPIIDRKRKPIDDEGEIYGGMWGKVLLTAYGWLHPEGGPGVSFSLDAFQKVGDDEPFGRGGVDVDSAFEALDDEDMDDEDELELDDDDDGEDLFE